jgi:hypothetical protein
MEMKRTENVRLLVSERSEELVNEERTLNVLSNELCEKTPLKSNRFLYVENSKEL